MRKLNIDEIKHVELNLLLAFDRICKENNLRYSLAYGTLIGAVRHKGFIPWDDDIDVLMPREDYEKLMKIHGEGTGRYRLFSSSLGNMPSGFCKYRDMNVSTKYKYIFKDVDDRELGIDIFPMDNAPLDDAEAIRLWKKTSYYRIRFDICALRFRNKFLAVITSPFLAPFRIRSRMAWTRKAEAVAMSLKEKTGYIENFIWNFDNIKERVPSSTFDEEPVMLDFEGHKFPAFSYYIQFLTNMYGDYMQLPPENKRKSHGIDAYLIDESLGL